jgi:hypothetical protein
MTQSLRIPLVRLILGIVVLAAPGMVSVAKAQSNTFLSFVSEPGDFIGMGQSLTVTPADGAAFTAQVSQDGGQIAITVFPPNTFWFVHLAAPAGQPLAPGSYESATRWPFQSPSEPGLDFSGDGRGCNTLTGRFEVLEAVYGPLGFVERFHARFEQHCEGAEPALFGEVKIVSPPPPPVLTIALTINPDGGTKRLTGTAQVSGTVSCSAPTVANLFGTLSQRVTRFALATGSFHLSVDCSETPTPWSAEIPPAGGVPFGGGPAEVDVSASAFDPNYGVFVTHTASSLVRLRGR